MADFAGGFGDVGEDRVFRLRDTPLALDLPDDDWNDAERIGTKDRRALAVLLAFVLLSSSIMVVALAAIASGIGLATATLLLVR